MSKDAQIINAITGESVATNMKFFMSLEEFKKFISQKWGIPMDQLLILLPFGNKLKLASFKEFVRNSTVGGNEFYVYDRRLFSIVSEPGKTRSIHEMDHEMNERIRAILESLIYDTPHKDESALFKPIGSPLIDADLNLENLSHRTITSLLTTNLGWLSALEIDLHYFRKLIQENMFQTSSILKCLTICEQYLKLYCYDVEKLYNSNVGFLSQLAENGSSYKWKDCYNDVLGNLYGLEGCLQKYVDIRSLENNENALKRLDQNVNRKLKNIKDELDTNAELRNRLSTHIEALRSDFSPGSLKDHLEELMLSKFEELVQETRDSSRNILEQDLTEPSKQDLIEAQTFLTETRNGVTSKLFTIANALHSQAETVIEKKRTLQKDALIALGQIAFVQVEALGIKKILLNDCNRDLESYQNLELKFAQVEDLPLIYGLYLIERYRRQLWISQVANNTFEYSEELKTVREKEKMLRARWHHKFGSMTSIFHIDNENLSDFERLDKSLNELSNFYNHSDESKQSNKDLMLQTFKVIGNYMTQINSLGVSKEVSELLSQSFSEANTLKLVFHRSKSAELLVESPSRQIDGYRARIKKLESLLHDSKYSDPIHWPSGVLNTTYMQPFHNNISTVSSRIALNSYVELDPSNNANITNMMDMQTNIQELRHELEQLTAQADEKDQLLCAANTKITDLELEKTAFKESLAHLNAELARLTEDEEARKRVLLEQQNNFKLDIQRIIQENTGLREELTVGTNNFKEIENRSDELVKQVANSRRDFDIQKAALTQKVEELTQQNEELEKGNIMLQKANNEFVSAQNRVSLNINQSTQTVSVSKDDSPITKPISEAMQQLCEKIESKMYNVFTSDVFILENIGLLLSFDDEDRVLIKRVKGLKKGQNTSILDESTQIPENDTVLKSSVFRNVKEKYKEVQGTEEFSKHEDFLRQLNKIYDDKLFEDAVIRRFKDIEFLAKKLTKENKKKKCQLERLQNERVALNNFQIGDLALFLPTKENLSLSESSESSLTSSFTSIDLSTPPPFDALNMLSSPTKQEKCHKIRRRSPWAAFTAFDDNTRYFLKDEDGLTKGREWFVGNILSLEGHVTDGQNYNPYKLPKGTVWYDVTASIVSLLR